MIVSLSQLRNKALCAVVEAGAADLLLWLIDVKGFDPLEPHPRVRSQDWPTCHDQLFLRRLFACVGFAGLELAHSCMLLSEG